MGHLSNSQGNSLSNFGQIKKLFLWKQMYLLQTNP